jgi:hypothetical protein
VSIFYSVYILSIEPKHLAAAEENNKLKFAGLRIYGLLTDLSQFKFYSYNPTTEEFCHDENIVIEELRTMVYSDMIDGM